MAGHRRLARRGRLAGLLATAPILGFVSLFAIVPFLVLVLGGLAAIGPGGVGAVVANPLNLRALDNSLVQGALSAAAAVSAGYPLGLLLGRYRWPGREQIRSLLVIPFLLPTVVVALGIAELFGPQGIARGPLASLQWFGRGIPAIVAANVVFNAPIVALLTAVGVESASAEAERQIEPLGAGPWARYRAVWGPPSWAAAGAGALLTFVFSALAFAAPLLLCGPRCYTLEARVWSLSQLLLQPATAAVLAGVMTVVLLPFAAAYYALATRARAGAAGRSPADRGLPWRSPAIVGLLAPVALLAGLIVATAAVVLANSGLWSSAPGRGWGALVAPATTSTLGISVAGALGNTLLFAALSAGTALVLAIATGQAARTLAPRSRQLLSVAVFVPLLVSPVTLAFGLAQLWRPLFGGESEVWLLIVLSQTTIALPFGLQALLVGLGRLPAAASEGLQSLGARRWTAYLEAELPLARGALYTLVLFAFAVSLGEFTATYFLATPTFTTVPVALYHLEATRHEAVGSALAGLLLLVSGALFLALSWGGRRVEL